MKLFYRLRVALCAAIVFCLPFGYCLALLPLLGTSGCATAERQSARVVGTARISAETLLRGWNEYLGVQQTRFRELEKTDPGAADLLRKRMVKREEKVRDAYERYQKANDAVINTAIAVKAGSLKPATLDLATAAAVAALTDFAELVELLKR
jgi:hypothetical protein